MSATVPFGTYSCLPCYQAVSKRVEQTCVDDGPEYAVAVKRMRLLSKMISKIPLVVYKFPQYSVV